MRLPSPDETLVSAADGLLAIPQRRGVALPSAVLPVPFLQVLGYSVSFVAAVRLWSSLPPGIAYKGAVLAVVFALATLTSSFTGVLRARRLLRDARAWSPSLAARYRSEALKARETEAYERYLLLLATVGVASAGVAVARDIGDTLPGAMLAFVALGLTVAAVGRTTARYASCAMPRDPDATYRPAPAPGLG